MSLIGLECACGCVNHDLIVRGIFFKGRVIGLDCCELDDGQEQAPCVTHVQTAPRTLMLSQTPVCTKTMQPLSHRQ